MTRWLRGYRMMLAWEGLNLRRVLPLAVLVQVLAGAGFAIGIGFFRQPSTRDALFLATGAAVVTLALGGLVQGPRIVLVQKATGAYDFLWSLPVPRSATAAAWVSVTVLVGLPGTAVALAVAAYRYHVPLHLGWAAVPALLVTAVTAALAGYTLAHAVDRPMVTFTISQALVYVLVGFAPISFPPDRLPVWLDRLHDWLIFKPMAVVVRSAFAPQLATGPYGGVVRSYLVLAVWMVALLAVSTVVIGRRR